MRKTGICVPFKQRRRLVNGSHRSFNYNSIHQSRQQHLQSLLNSTVRIMKLILVQLLHVLITIIVHLQQ